MRKNTRSDQVKWQCHEIFCFRFFSRIIPPKTKIPEDIPKSRWTLDNRYQRHWQQILPPVPRVPHLKVNLKENYPKVSKKISDWIYIPFNIGVNDNGGVPYVHEFLKKFEMALMLTQVLGGTDSSKKPEVENLVTLSLTCNFFAQSPIFLIFTIIYVQSVQRI